MPTADDSKPEQNEAASSAQIERRRQLRFLLGMALIVLAVSIVRAGVGKVFPHSWWHLW